jgi:MFS family permease
MSSTIFAPGASQAMHDLGAQSEIYKSLSITISVVGLAIGPLISAPLSELYGRTPLMHISNFAFLVAAIVCAVSNSVPLLLTFRLLMGASTISLGGGYVADMMEPEERGRALNVWTLGPVLVRFLEADFGQSKVILLILLDRRLSWVPLSAVTFRSRRAGAGRLDW